MSTRATLVPGVRVGELRLGAPRGEVEALFGPPEASRVFEEEQTVYLSYFGRGLDVRVIDGAIEGVLVYSGRAGGYETARWSRFAGAFADGLDLDASLAQVLERFGAPEHAGDLPDAPIPSRWLSYTSRGAGFDFVEATGELIYVTIFVPRRPPAEEL